MTDHKGVLIEVREACLMLMAEANSKRIREDGFETDTSASFHAKQALTRLDALIEDVPKRLARELEVYYETGYRGLDMSYASAMLRDAIETPQD